MKLICSKANLLKGVNIVSKAVPTRTTMAILECILIDASANEIKLMANDMELGIETIIDGTIEERGIIALDAKIFSEIVRKLPDNDVTIETDASFKTVISCEKAKFNIIGKSGDDFSYIPYVERNESIVLSQFTLKEVIRQTIFSIADNDNNKLMTGELFEIEENKLRVVSLDGHRISIRYIEMKNHYDSKKVVVPGKTLQEISKIIPGSADEDVVIYITNNHIVFEFENTTVVSSAYLQNGYIIFITLLQLFLVYHKCHVFPYFNKKIASFLAIIIVLFLLELCLELLHLCTLSRLQLEFRVLFLLLLLLAVLLILKYTLLLLPPLLLGWSQVLLP